MKKYIYTARRALVVAFGISIVFLGMGGPGKALSAATPPLYEVKGSVDISSQPARQLSLNPLTHTVYIAGGFAQGGLSVVDVASTSVPTVTATVFSGGGVAVDVASNSFYTSGGYNGTFLAYDGVTNSLMSSRFLGYCGGFLDANQVTHQIAMVSQCGPLNDPIHLFDIASNAIVVGPVGTGGVADHVLSNSSSGRLYAVSGRPFGDTMTTRVFETVPSFSFVSDIPGNLRAINPVTNRLYLEAPGQADDLVVLDGTTHVQLALIVGGGSGGQSTVYGVNTELDRLYVPDPLGGSIKVIDTAHNSIVGTIVLDAGFVPSPGGPIAVDSSTDTLYVVGTNGLVQKLFILGAHSITPEDQISVLRALIDDLVLSGGSGQTQSLLAKLDGAAQDLDKDSPSATAKMNAFVNELSALVKSKRMSEAQGALFTNLAQQIIAAIEGELG